MGFYRKIDSRIQNDRKFRSLSRDARLAWYDIFSHPNLNNFGAMRTTIVGLAADLGEDHKTFVKAFEENQQKDLIKFSDMFLWFPNFLKYNAPASANVVKSWPKLLDALPDCGLKNECIHTLASFCREKGIEEPLDLKKGLIEDLTEALSKEHSKENMISIYISNKEVKEESEKPLETIPPYHEIVQYLNNTVKAKFQVTDSLKHHVNARFKESATLDDFKYVIDIKNTEWSGTEREQYLRPKTLFSPENFWSYRNQKTPRSAEELKELERQKARDIFNAREAAKEKEKNAS